MWDRPGSGMEPMSPAWWVDSLPLNQGSSKANLSQSSLSHFPNEQTEAPFSAASFGFWVRSEQNHLPLVLQSEAPWEEGVLTEE